MHLKYPRKRDHYSWEELRCLAKALGFRKDLFYRNIPKEIDKEKLTGLSVKLLSYLLDIKSLHGDVHRTYNMHDALYNSRVIEKAIDMLSNRYLSFQELREVRVAFQLYEHDDMLGLTIDDRTLLRTLKICGRTVSLVKLRQHIKHMPRQVSDRLLLFEFLDLLLLCERDSEVQLQQPLQITGVDKNNLYKLCDFQAVLSTEDQKKIHHLDNLYEQGSVRVFSEKQREFPSWRLQHHFLVDSNPRIELVSREQQRSVELCDHVNHSNKKVKHARCGFLGTSRKAAAFVDLNDVNKKLKPLTRYPVQLESLPLQHQQDENIKAEGTLDVFLEKGQEDQMVAAKVESASSGSQRFYRGFNGTTSDKLSRMSKAGRQGILVTPRDLHNSHMMTENLQWDIETQSQRLKQRMEKQMREKYADYYKRLQRLHESDSTPGNSCAENSMEGKMKNSPPVDTHLISEEDIPPMNFVVTPRKQVPKRDSIYKSLMSRLQRNNSLLVFGKVRVQDPGTSILRCTSDDQLPRQRLHVKTLSSNRRENERTVDIRKLASMSSLRRKTDEEYGTREDEVEHLLERLQEANYIASGKRGMTLHNQFVFAR